MATKSKSFTYNLTLFERLVFLNIYPSRGDHASQLLHEALSRRLITDEERNDVYQIKSSAECPICGANVEYKDQLPAKCSTKNCLGKPKPTAGVVWRTKDDDGNDIIMEKDVTIGEMANHTITRVLKELDEAEALDVPHKTLYQKIVAGGIHEMTPEEEEKILMAPLPKDKK